MAALGAPPAASRLAFTQLSPAPDVGFWQELTRRKLDVWRLDSSPAPVHGYFEAPPAVGAPEKCFLLREGFDAPPSFPAGAVWLRGDLKNFNAVEEFRTFLSGEGRAMRVAETGAELRRTIESGKVLDDPVLLRPLLAVAFADLKKYHYAYTVSMPVLAPPGSWSTFAATQPAEQAGIDREALARLSEELRIDNALAAAGIFLLVRDGPDAQWNTRPLAELRSIAERGHDSANVIVGFVDPSSSPEAPGYPLRNLLVVVARHWPGQRRILAFRDPHLAARGASTATRSVVFSVDCSEAAASAALADPAPKEVLIAGWSKIQNFDLTAFLDKKRVAADAVDLNVKLMKWRLLPDMDPGKMNELRFLLLGSGTLGCGVARSLMGWGVRKMTFVDSGRVSFSNPVRQSLFTHRDAAEGRGKAKAAREAVEAIMPDAEVMDVELDIPMPGHPHAKPEVLRASIRKLRELIDSHDVVCMLTDSRESRWLPSLLVSASQTLEVDRPPPLGLTCALGFDSFLVGRQTWRKQAAACYFCNDVTAPRDSLAFRTLDQQCTVTRPGVSGFASNVAVELVAALVQHPDGFSAAASEEAGASPLGATPHQIRGYLGDFRLAPMETEPFSRCICCSAPVLARLAAEGDAFIERVVADSSELEEISGLKAMKEAVHDEDVMSFGDDEEFDD